MTQLLIRQSQHFHSILSEQTTSNTSRSNQIHSVSATLFQMFNQFTNSINNTCRNIFKKLKYDQHQDPSIIFLSKFTVDLLAEMSKKFNFICKKIKNQVLDPLEQFCESQRESYGDLVDRSADLGIRVVENGSYVDQLVKNYGHNISSDMIKEQQEDMKKIFEIQMRKCNQNWQQIKTSYKKLLSETDSINSFRCNFTIKTQVKICRILNRIVSSPHVQQALLGYQQLYDENQSLSILIKERVRDYLGKSLLLEESKGGQMEELEMGIGDRGMERVGVDEFIGMFMSGVGGKEGEEKYEKARTLVLSNSYWSSYFLTRLRTNLHTQIKLPALKYHQMTTIIKYLFATCAQQQKNQQTIYNLMYISYRMSYNGNYIIRELGKHQSYWQNPARWYELIQYLKNSREDGHGMKKNGKNQKVKKMLRSGLNWITMNNQKISTEKKIRSEKIIADAKAYDVLCEMNYFMSRLELKQKFIFDFIIEASEFYGVSSQNKKKLLKFHYFNKPNGNNKINANYIKRKKHIEQKYKNVSRQKMICICIGKCLPYLQPTKSLLQLRLVHSSWSKHLLPKLSKRFLLHPQAEPTLPKTRIHIYSAFCPSIITPKIFQRMLEQLPQFTEHSDIIKLDARRSLAWDQSLRETLVTVLKCYAFFHPNVGYLQGMNYLCENILKLTDQRYQVYRIFQFLMNNPFQGMYSANFDGLRTKIYQFMRILQLQKPKLYDHFQTQKLQGQHFVLPWAITLWGEMSGDLCWVLWDGFVCKGWKWWFKTLLWLLNVLEPELLKMNFEEMMKCFSELSTGLLNMNTKELKEFGIDIVKAKKQIDAIPIHKDLLKELEKQYKVRVQMVNQYLKKIVSPTKDRKRMFK